MPRHPVVVSSLLVLASACLPDLGAPSPNGSSTSSSSSSSSGGASSSGIGSSSSGSSGGSSSDGDGSTSSSGGAQQGVACAHGYWQAAAGEVLVVSDTTLGEGTAILGTGEDARVQVLDDEGAAHFPDAAAGPHTVTILRPGNVMHTQVDVTSQVICFERMRVPSVVSVGQANSTIGVNVTGATDLSRVRVDLLVDGVRFESSTITNTTAGSTTFITTLLPPRPVVLRAFAFETAEDGSLYQLGTTVISSNFEGGITTDVTVPLDAPVSQRSSIHVQGTHTGLTARAGAFLFLDGQTYWPGDTSPWMDLAEDGSAQLMLPEGTGSLAEVEVRVLARTEDNEFPLFAEGPAQWGHTDVPLTDAGSIMVDLMALPEFATTVGTEAMPAEHAREGFSFNVTPPDGADAPWDLVITHDSPCLYFSWQVTLPSSTTTFTPIALPSSVEPPSIPVNKPLRLLALSNRAGHDDPATSADVGHITLTGEQTCSANVPEWLVGRFPMVARWDLYGFLADDHRFDISACGEFAYTVDGGDFRGTQCGTVEATGDPNVFNLVHHALWVGIMEGETTVSVQRIPETFHGRNVLKLTGVMQAEEAFLTEPITITPASYPEGAIGEWIGVTRVEDTLADNAGMPGAVLEGGTPIPVNGSDPAYGTVSVVLGADGTYEERWGVGVAVFNRNGLLDSWEGPRGYVSFTTTNGICQDEDARGTLTQQSPTQALMETVVKEIDWNDADGDMDSEDFIWVRRKLTLQKLTPAP